MYEFKSNQQQQNFFELLGGLLGTLIILAVYLAVPVLCIIFLLKIVF